MNRYYSSSLGRFTSPDPYGGSAIPATPQSWNRYTYVNNDPVNKKDPSGLNFALSLDCMPSTGRGTDDDGFYSSVVCTYTYVRGGDGIFSTTAGLTKIINKSQAKGLLTHSLSQLKDSPCGKKLAPYLQPLTNGVNNIVYWDARSAADGNKKASDIFSGSTDLTLQQMYQKYPGDAAWVITNKDGVISNNVVLTDYFFSSSFSRADQGGTLVHEEFHAILKIKDPTILDIFKDVLPANAQIGDFSNWLSNCLK
jgi:uncharacterized protein RhaS with RHS repeats